MKVEFEEAGCLAIIAETPLESFALGQWLTLHCAGRAPLRIETQHGSVSASSTLDRPPEAGK